MKRTLTIRGEYDAARNRETQPAACFEVSLDGRLIERLELGPVPATAPALIPVLSLGFGLGIARNLMRSIAATGRLLTELDLEVPASLPPQAWSLVDLFGELSDVDVRLDASRCNRLARQPAVGRVFLLSGGKDTLYALRRAEEGEPVARVPAVYLGAGSELNWRNEVKVVCSRADLFGLGLHHLWLLRYPVSGKAPLRFGNRATWREIITVAMARAYGSRIYTGINLDSFARRPQSHHDAADYFSQIEPVLTDLAAMLGATIETVPDELTVYAAIRKDPAFDRKGSCLRPDCGSHGRLCAKCRTFAIYDSHLDRGSLRPSELAFLHSDHYLGDGSLRLIYPRHAVSTRTNAKPREGLR